MRKLLFFISIPFFIIASELEYKGNFGFQTSYLNHDISNKRDTALALYLEAEIKKSFGDGEIAIKLKSFFDKDDKNRRYFDFNDLYYRYNFENSDILIGRNTRFWGALEFYNLSDIFNTKDFLDNPFDYDSKLGAWNVAYTRYLENSEVSLIIKLYEDRQPMQDIKSINNFFPLPYNDKLNRQKGKNRPSVFLKYSGSLDEVQMDYGFVYQNGYDSSRYMSLEDNFLVQNAYIVDKFIGYATYIHGDMIYKTELVYALSDDKEIADYGEFGFGLEYTLYGFWDTKDLGLLSEYYYNDNKKDAKKLGKFFANDLTFGFRLSLNDQSSSEVLGGFDIDLDNEEKIFFVKYDTRVLEKYKLGLSYQRLDPVSDSSFKELDQLKLDFGYYF